MVTMNDPPRPPRVLAFIGAGCVGKTTLFELYRQRLADDERVAFAAEAAKPYFQRNRMPEHIRFSRAVQGEIQEIALANEVALATQRHLVISDRSVIDYAIYVSAMGDSAGAEVLFERVRAWLPAYRALFLLDPHGVTFEQTAERRETAETRDLLHSAFLERLSNWQVDYSILSGTLEARARVVDAAIDELL